MSPRDERARAAEAWLPGAPSRSRSGARGGARKRTGKTDSEASQWLPDPDSRLRARHATRPTAEPAPAPEIERIKELLVDATERLEALDSKTTAKKATAKKKPAAKRAPSRRRRPASNGKGLDLNRATFEELREVGLSITQSAQVIAHRDIRGGYSSMDELDEIPRLSEVTREKLRSRSSV